MRGKLPLILYIPLQTTLSLQVHYVLMYFFVFVLVCLFLCEGNNFSSDVVIMLSLSLLQVVLKYSCWCRWAAMGCALGLTNFPYVMFVSGLHIRFSLDKFGWEVS